MQPLGGSTGVAWINSSKRRVISISNQRVSHGMEWWSVTSRGSLLKTVGDTGAKRSILQQ